MLRWLVVVYVVVVSATASAQPAATASAQPAATDRARAQVTAAEQQLAKLAGARGPLARRYEDELRAIDRLKQARPSWRRDRELREQLSDSAELANQLSQLARDQAGAETALAAARRALASAIDAELAAGATGERARQLAAERDKLAPQVGKTAKKIVIPDCDDTLGDPEELDQCAAALRQSEDELTRQAQGLDGQAKRLARAAELKKQHERANDLAQREDDQPTRTQPTGTGGTRNDTVNPSGAGSAGGGGAGAGAGGGPERVVGAEELVVVLGDIVDRGTIEGWSRAQRSGDPQQLAAAAVKARDAVNVRLDKLRKQRQAIEQRARTIRKKPRSPE